MDDGRLDASARKRFNHQIGRVDFRFNYSTNDEQWRKRSFHSSLRLFRKFDLFVDWSKNEFFSLRSVYNEEVRDLFSRGSRRLEVREKYRTGSLEIKNLRWKRVWSMVECLKLKGRGDSNRTMGSTEMNGNSSRSHTMFSLLIRCFSRKENKFVRRGKINFVDLGEKKRKINFVSKILFFSAGSERQRKTGGRSDQLFESSRINLSLSALNKVISSLVEPKTRHVAYRDSKLTRLLRDSIGGTTKTIMIACVSPSEENYQETLCTLRFEERNFDEQTKIDRVLRLDTRAEQEIFATRRWSTKINRSTSPKLDRHNVRPISIKKTRKSFFSSTNNFNDTNWFLVTFVDRISTAKNKLSLFCSGKSTRQIDISRV